jgi:hypothetical protein
MFIAALIVIVAILVAVSRFRVSGSATDLGWMSQQWLAEYRAAHGL